MLTHTAEKLPASAWFPFFEKADLLTKALNETQSMKGRTIKIGRFFGPNLNRPVPIQVGGRSGFATLRVENDNHARSKRYFFEIAWEVAVSKETAKAQQCGGPNTEPNTTQTPSGNLPLSEASSTKKSTPIGATLGNDEAWE